MSKTFYIYVALLFASHVSGFCNLNIFVRTSAFSNIRDKSLMKLNSVKNPKENFIDTLINLRAILVSSAFLYSQIPSVSAIDESPEVINLNETTVDFTNTAWLDISIGNSPAQRVEIGLYGSIAPRTVQNFIDLCNNKPGYGYRNRFIVFRVLIIEINV